MAFPSHWFLFCDDEVIHCRPGAHLRTQATFTLEILRTRCGLYFFLPALVLSLNLEFLNSSVNFMMDLMTLLMLGGKVPLNGLEEGALAQPSSNFKMT